jgi:putative endonuclease
MTNVSRTLYTGVTNNLAARVCQHKGGQIPGFTARYHVTRLAYYEEFDRIQDAIAREKQIKGLLRARKIELIETQNPGWVDLSEGW